jgi:hypothetical protein
MRTAAGSLPRAATQHCPFRVPASTGASWRAVGNAKPVALMISQTNKKTRPARRPVATRALARAHWRRCRQVYQWRRGWRSEAGAGAGRRGLLLLAQLHQPCEACVASARQPPILDAGAPVVGAGDVPAPRPEPARIFAPGPCAPAPASASAPDSAETRPTSDTLPIATHIQKALHCQTSVFFTAPLTAQTLPSTPPEVYYDTACQLVS